MNIIIEDIPLNDIRKFNKAKYNSNNHWTNGKKPPDYFDVIEKCNTCNWVDIFHNNYSVLNLQFTKNEFVDFINASNIATITGNFPQIYGEDFEELLKKFSHLNKYFDGTGYFVRTNSVSLKTGFYKTGPYYDLKSILISVITSAKGHTPIVDINNCRLKLYLMNWVNIDKNLEFRMFVFNKKITCISQQFLYTENTLLTGNNDLIMDAIHKLVAYFNDSIKNHIQFANSYTVDIAIVEDHVYLIEFNTFGKEYGSGSSLFHWVIDEDKLLNNENIIYFRYVSSCEKSIEVK